jgi:hypothetical protein
MMGIVKGDMCTIIRNGKKAEKWLFMCFRGIMEEEGRNRRARRV